MNPNGIPINTANKEHPICYSMHQALKIDQSDGWKSINLPVVERLKDKFVIGAFVMRQSDGAKKKSWHEGTTLLSTEAAVNTYLTYKKDGCAIMDKLPLEQLLVDYNSGPGKYAQSIQSEINMKESFIQIDTSCLNDPTEVLVIHYVYVEPEYCYPIKSC